MSNFLPQAPSPAERQRWTTFYQQQLENRLRWAVELVGQHKELATPLKDHFGTLLMLLRRARALPHLHPLVIQLISLLHPWPLRWSHWNEWEAELRFAAEVAGKLNQPVQQSEFLGDLAEHLQTTGHFKEGLKVAKRALKLAREQGALIPMARAGNVVVFILRISGEGIEAQRLLSSLEWKKKVKMLRQAQNIPLRGPIWPQNGWSFCGGRVSWSKRLLWQTRFWHN